MGGWVEGGARTEVTDSMARDFPVLGWAGGPVSAVRLATFLKFSEVTTVTRCREDGDPDIHHNIASKHGHAHSMHIPSDRRFY